MRTLKELLPKKNIPSPAYFKQSDVSLDDKTVFFVCKKILLEEYGVRGSENVLPARYQDKKLFLTARSSLWANEVYLGRAMLQEKINKQLGSGAVSEIKITSGSL